MKALLQTIMVGGGLVGLLVSTPVAFVAWRVHSGFGGSLPNSENFVILSPAVCLVALLSGGYWIKKEKRNEKGV